MFMASMEKLQEVLNLARQTGDRVIMDIKIFIDKVPVEGGQGKGASRVIGTSSDTTRINQSPFGRIEGFADARTTSDATRGVISVVP